MNIKIESDRRGKPRLKVEGPEWFVKIAGPIAAAFGDQIWRKIKQVGGKAKSFWKDESRMIKEVTDEVDDYGELGSSYDEFFEIEPEDYE